MPDNIGIDINRDLKNIPSNVNTAFIFGLNWPQSIEFANSQGKKTKERHPGT